MANDVTNVYKPSIDEMDLITKANSVLNKVMSGNFDVVQVRAFCAVTDRLVKMGQFGLNVEKYREARAMRDLRVINGKSEPEAAPAATVAEAPPTK